MQGSELKAIRKTLGMSQAAFADALGLTAKFVGMMERGDAPLEKRTELAARYLELVGGRERAGASS
ncbi:helix-turn-helix transcriptional regulator [Sphingomonas sp. CARO-RG-8B-R24-01]|uniref:helix-turn-helix domain-containing protein n=1 Tax=Sphingomonas sp. CARO-RG-8B-R24-01 TaxID=2914831 RepID=UPI001F57B133|nr:helix-turn-helix transcriptional regulator [Sphingomonas sp. CARO-RG-8B-R24-01]